MPIPITTPRPGDPKAWPTMAIEDGPAQVRVVETWPSSVTEVADIDETLSGSGPNVTLSMVPGEPQTCVWRAEQSSRYQRPGWDVAIRAEVEVTADPHTFFVAERLVATLNGETVADAHTRTDVPRILM